MTTALHRRLVTLGVLVPALLSLVGPGVASAQAEAEKTGVVESVVPGEDARRPFPAHGARR